MNVTFINATNTDRTNREEIPGNVLKYKSSFALLRNLINNLISALISYPFRHVNKLQRKFCKIQFT